MGKTDHGNDSQRADETHSPDSVLRPEPILWGSGDVDPILGLGPSSDPILGDLSEVSLSLTELETEESPDEAGTPEPHAVVVETPKQDEPQRRPRTPLPEASDRLCRWLLMAAVFVVPVVFDPRTVDAFNLAKITSLWALVVAATAAWWIGRIAGRARVPLLQSPLMWPVLALLATASVAAAFSPNRTLSLIGLYHRYEGLASLAVYAGMFALIVLVYRDHPERLRELLAAAGASAILVSVYVIAQRAGADPFQWRGATGLPPPRPIGSLGNTAFTAAYLGIAVPLIVYLAVSAKSAVRFAWSAGAAASLIALSLAGGRAGLLAALFGVGALILFSSPARARTKLAFVAAALVALGLMPLASSQAVDPSAGEGQPDLAEFRVDTWVAAARMFGDRPVLGWGPESFYGQFPRFRTADEARAQGLAITDKPHNIFLGWATSVGMVGVAVYLLLIGLALASVARRAAGRHSFLAAAFGAGLVAYLVQGLYSVDVPPLAMMGWLALSGIAAIAASQSSGRSPALSEPKKLSPVPALGIGVLALVLIVMGFGPLRADHAAWEAERESGGGWSPQALRLYESAIQLHPRESAYYGLLAAFLERTSLDGTAPGEGEDNLRRAASLYERATSMQPGNLYFMIGAARVYAHLGESSNVHFEAADRWLRFAVSHDPLDPQVYDLRADLLRRWAAHETDPQVSRPLTELAASLDETAEGLRAG